MELYSPRRLLAVVAYAGLLCLTMNMSSSDAATTAPVPVRIGVVLDLTSEVGRKSLACISMALEDFYLKHPSYTTRAELLVRDTRGDLVTAAYAAEELMNKNGHLQAILAPHISSAELELFASIAKRTDIPILSFSAVSPSPSSSRARFLVRTAADGSSQPAVPIAAVLEAFAWRAAVLLHEDSLYGIGILPALVNAFQGHAYRARGVTNSLAVPADATDSRLDAALLAAKGMPERVYIVHMAPALAARLFRRAMAAGMMSEGYVWIATTGVCTAADSLDPGDIDYMQGVVSLRPHVQATDQLRSFSKRFKAKYFRQDLDDAVHHYDPSAPPVWLLWLYDTAWATATAAEVSFGTTTQGTTALVDALLHTTFDGLAGRFMLVDGQLQVSAYEIVNTVGEGGGRTVGFWTPESGITTSLRPKSGNELKQILWPGETAVTPVGWSESPDGRPLRVAVPVKSGFLQFVEISGQPRNERVTGYCIDVFHAVMTTKLAYSVAYQYVPVNDSTTRAYDALVNLVHEKNVDALVGDVTITASRMKSVSFTVPFADPGWSMVVAEEDMSNDMWIFLKPLTPSLWLTSLAFFFFTGFVVWAIEHRINPRFRGTPWKQFGVLFYFAFSTLVFSHKEKLESNMSKMVVITWVFAVLILTTSYTAILSSILTVRQLQPTINLLGGRDYVGYQEGSCIAGFLKEMGFDEARLRGYTTIDEYADALKRGSENGGVTAIFDEVPYLRLFLSRYCRGFTMAGPTYKSGGFGFVFQLGSPLAQDVSRAILELAEEEKLARIESRWFGHLGACVSAGGDDSSSATLGVRRFGGLFLVNAAVSGLVLLVHLAKFVSRERGGELAAGAPAGALPWMRAWLRRFDALDGPQRRNGGGAEDRNRRALAAEQEEAAVRDFTSVDTTSMELDATDSGRNPASVLAASGETSAPATGGSPP